MELIADVFPTINARYQNVKCLFEREGDILSPKILVISINFELLKIIPGNCQSYKSVDTFITQLDAVNYPTAFLNSLGLSGLPPHRLVPKIGSPIILLGNLDPIENYIGTRIILKRMLPMSLKQNLFLVVREAISMYQEIH